MNVFCAQIFLNLMLNFLDHINTGDSSEVWKSQYTVSVCLSSLKLFFFASLAHQYQCTHNFMGLVP